MSACPGICDACGTCDVCGQAIPPEELPRLGGRFEHTCGPCRWSTIVVEAEIASVVDRLHFAAADGRVKRTCAIGAAA